MAAGPTPQEARRLLGVTTDADTAAIKRAYHRRARQHHPDLGGDPDTFHRLRLAYERLTGVSAAPERPARVSRGRPSRPPVPFLDPSRALDTSWVDWEAPLPEDGSPLTRDRLARWLAGPGPAAVNPLRAASRAPGSRMNRFAGSLSPELTSTLTVLPNCDDQGRTLVAICLAAANRRSRRALERADLDKDWTRTRGSSSTQLRAVLPPSPDRHLTAVRVAEVGAALLDALAWPLENWTITMD